MLMGLIFKLLPDAKIAWRDVWIGSLVTAVLFEVGKVVIGLYIGKASVGSAFHNHWKRFWQIGLASSEAPETALPIVLPLARTRPASTDVP